MALLNSPSSCSRASWITIGRKWIVVNATSLKLLALMDLHGSSIIIKTVSLMTPTFIPAPIATRIAPALSVSSSDVSQPAATTDAIFSEPLAHEVRIGKSEAYVALTMLLDAHHVPSPGAVDITTEEGFHWRRWLNNVWPARDIVGDGIAKVFAVRQPPQGQPALALCCSDDTYCLVHPSKKTRATAIERLQGWMNLEVFQNAQAATANWMSLRRPAVSFT